MADIYGLNGEKINRTTPTIDMDTPEGNFTLPVVVLAGPSFDALVQATASAVLEEVLPLLYEQLELPFED